MERTADEEPEGDWRAAFESLRTPSAPQAVAHAPTTTGLALQVQLRRLEPRSAAQWNGPTSKAVPPAQVRGAARVGQVRLAAAPVGQTGRGWARGSLTWSSIVHLRHRLNLDPAQHRWFCELGGLVRAPGGPAASGDADWILLDDVANPVLWALLRQAESLGIPVVGARGVGPVRVAPRSRLQLDLVGTAAGLAVTPRLESSGGMIPLDWAQPIGGHGLYTVDAGSRAITLAELDIPLDEQRRGLLAGTTDAVVHVPADATAEFLAEYVPVLRASVELVSSDASVDLPAPEPPVLVLTAAFGAEHALDLRWHWDRSPGAVDPPPLAALLPAGLVPEAWLPDGDGALPPATSLTGLDTADFAERTLPRLAALPGVRVETVGEQPAYRELAGVPELVVTAVPAEKPDWFDLGVTVTVDGRQVPFQPLFRALAQGRRRLLLVDGSHLSLAHPAFAGLAALIEEAQDLHEWQTGPRISRYQTSVWAEFEDLADEARPAVEWRALLAEARGSAPMRVATPQGLRAELRPYQQAGLEWLAFLWRHRLGGVLADDMGLGKTVQCLALMQHVAEHPDGVQPDGARRPFLVVAPTSVVGNWIAEAARFTPGLLARSVTVSETTSTTSIADLARGADLVVTSYALFRMDFDAYQAVARGTGWAGLILDEAQFVKNGGSRAHECAVDLDVPVKLAVTGTPLENSLAELRALFAIVAPGLFPSPRHFTEEYVRPIEQAAPGIRSGVGAGSAPAVAAEARAERLARLRRRIRPFLLRRTKEAVAPELLPKQEQVLAVELAPAHRALYDVWLQRERRKLFDLLPDLDRNRFIVFRSLTLLRMLALDASLIGEEYAGVPSSKLDVLMEQLEDVLAEGHRALVFSQFTSYLALVARRLTGAGVRHAYLDGGTRDRDRVIADFKSGDAGVFLISLKAGGFGLNLTEADYVFVLDPWWNPATEAQAVDRAHRIGQTRNVLVYRLVATGTIEEKVMALKARKAALFDAVVDDDGQFAESLTADDVRGLLA